MADEGNLSRYSWDQETMCATGFLAKKGS